MAYKLIGQNYPTPDLVAKVTGQAKYSEDFRAAGMLYCRLLVSPMPHARVRSIDTSEALKMAGVKAILTANDLPPVPTGGGPGGPPPGPAAAAPPEGAGRRGGGRGQAAIAVDEHGQAMESGRGGAAAAPQAVMRPEPALTNEPMYEGEPILAVAAIDEATAVAAIEKIKVAYEPLPFVVDPLESLRPGGRNARLEGNVVSNGHIIDVKWTEADFAESMTGAMPMGHVSAADQWTLGDIDAGFKEAAVVIDESFNIPTTSHIALEPRSAHGVLAKREAVHCMRRVRALRTRCRPWPASWASIPRSWSSSASTPAARLAERTLRTSSS